MDFQALWPLRLRLFEPLAVLVVAMVGMELEEAKEVFHPAE
jgi:hypothetical protein